MINCAVCAKTTTAIASQLDIMHNTTALYFFSRSRDLVFRIKREERFIGRTLMQPGMTTLARLHSN
jgi:hypothetical protein